LYKDLVRGFVKDIINKPVNLGPF